MFEKYNPFYGKVERNLRGLHQYSDSFWYMYGAVLTQGGEQMADSSTGRTFLSFWWIFCIIMMATYSGNLIASLSITKEILPFDSLQGLAEQDSYTYGFIGNSAYETLLKYSVLPYRRTIWENIVKFNATDPSVISSNSDIQFQKVLKGNYAFIIDRTFIEHVMVNNCDLAKADQDFLPLPYSIGLPHESPYTKIFTEKILSIQEGGLLNAWKLKRWPTSGLCEGKLQNTAKTVTLVDIQSAFYLIGIGIFIGTLTLFIEKLKRQL